MRTENLNKALSLLERIDSDYKLLVEANEILTEKHRPKGVDSRGKRTFRKENGKKQTYYPVSDANRYAQANNLQDKTMYKVGQIQARPSVSGRQNNGTRLDGGFAEREGYIENGNSMIVRNPKGEEYQVPYEEFIRKYALVPGSQPDENGYQTYYVLDKRQISSPIKHNIALDKSRDWGPGQKQFGRKGDAHFVNNDYLIGDPELRSTHTENPNENLRRRY